jgi:hypothetical protein
MSDPRAIDPTKLHVGDIVLVATRNRITELVQEALGYGASSRWTHVAGSLGGGDLIEGQTPKSRVAHLQDDYAAKSFPIKVLRRQWESEKDRIKVALWWATLNNLSYDFGELLWFAWGAFVFGKALLKIPNRFNSKPRKICSELIADGLYKQGYNLFESRPAGNILPADYDQLPSFHEVTNIWLETETRETSANLNRVDTL